MTKKQFFRLLPFLVILSFICAFWKYYERKELHHLLKTNGVEVEMDTRFVSKSGITYLNYSFVTKQGKRISRKIKSPDRENAYLSSTVIYLPSNPNQHELTYDFKKYDPEGRFFFSLFVFFPFLIVFFSIASHILFLLIKAFISKNKQQRREL